MLARTKRNLAAATAALGLTAGAVLATAAPASATDYSINMNQACAYFTNVGWAWASPSDANNPYTWHCSTAPAPAWVQWGGSLDLNLWCAYQVGGSAVVVTARTTRGRGDAASDVLVGALLHEDLTHVAKLG